MELPVFNTAGKETKKIKLNKEIFGAEPNEHVIYLDVKSIQAAKRQGTHKSKERAEVNYSTRKIKKQKGTGTARAGSIKSPIFVGGGTVFGPRPHKYNVGVSKKTKRLARISALSTKATSKAITLIENISFAAPKTKEMDGFLSNLKLAGKKTTIVLGESDKNVYLSSRNLKGLKVINASELNTYDIMDCQNLLLSEGAIEKLNETLG